LKNILRRGIAAPYMYENWTRSVSNFEPSRY
jgi:hypothetical protein